MIQRKRCSAYSHQRSHPTEGQLAQESSARFGRRLSRLGHWHVAPEEAPPRRLCSPQVLLQIGRHVREGRHVRGMAGSQPVVVVLSGASWIQEEAVCPTDSHISIVVTSICLCPLHPFFAGLQLHIDCCSTPFCTVRSSCTVDTNTGIRNSTPAASDPDPQNYPFGNLPFWEKR